MQWFYKSQDKVDCSVWLSRINFPRRNWFLWNWYMISGFSVIPNCHMVHDKIENNIFKSDKYVIPLQINLWNELISSLHQTSYSNIFYFSIFEILFEVKWSDTSKVHLNSKMKHWRNKFWFLYPLWKQVIRKIIYNVNISRSSSSVLNIYNPASYCVRTRFCAMTRNILHQLVLHVQIHTILSIQ